MRVCSLPVASVLISELKANSPPLQQFGRTDIADVRQGALLRHSRAKDQGMANVHELHTNGIETLNVFTALPNEEIP